MRKVSHWSKSSERSVFERIQRHGCHYADVISERLLHISPIVVTVISRYRPRALFRETGNGISSSNGKPFDDRLRRGFHDRVYRSNSFPFPKKWPISPVISRSVDRATLTRRNLLSLSSSRDMSRSAEEGRRRKRVAGAAPEAAAPVSRI